MAQQNVNAEEVIGSFIKSMGVLATRYYSSLGKWRSNKTINSSVAFANVGGSWTIAESQAAILNQLPVISREFKDEARVISDVLRISRPHCIGSDIRTPDDSALQFNNMLQQITSALNELIRGVSTERISDVKKNMLKVAFVSTLQQARKAA